MDSPVLSSTRWRLSPGGGEVEAHHPEQGVQESFDLAQREMVEEPQGQGGLDGEIRVAPLPAPPATPAGRPGSDRFRGHSHCHIAASNEGLIVGRPVRHPILRLIPGMDLRLHPCSVAPAEGPEKCGPRRPTRSGYSCNNATKRRRSVQLGLTTYIYLAQSGTKPISIPKIIGPRSSSNTTTMGTSKMFNRTPALAICGSVMRPLP